MDETYEIMRDEEDVKVVGSPISDDTLLGLAEQAERRIDAMNKIKRVAIKLTNRHDWTDQGGRPYLQVSGAEKIARMFGLSWRIAEPIKESLEGGHYSYTYKGYFTLAGATIEAIGTRSSKDGFFKKYSYTNGEKTELPASEIDVGDVKKAAYTNCIGNGITRLLGIRNLTYDDLREYAGITPDMIGKIEYKKAGVPDTPLDAEEKENQIICKISDVRVKTGKTKVGKDFKQFTIHGGGREFRTFSETTALAAKTAKELGQTVEITFKRGLYGYDIVDLIALTREPGEEG